MDKTAIFKVKKYYDILTTVEIKTPYGIDISKTPEQKDIYDWIRMNIHQKWELSSGDFSFRYQNIKYNQPAKLIFCNGNEMHGVNRMHDLDFTSIGISTDYINQLTETFDAEADQIFFKDFLFDSNLRLVSLYSTILRLTIIPGIDKITLDCLLTDLLVSILCQYKHTYSKRVERKISSGHFPNFFSKAKAVISERVFSSQSLDLSDLAGTVGLDKFYFTKYFKKHTGFSPIQYINKIRTDFIKEKLVNSKDAILEISNETGFEYLSTFNRVFKKNTEMSPKNYRRMACFLQPKIDPLL
jgi:AraC-like DNA-binding protein